jgi:Spy/CpxP family protein refolding chaperone
MKLPIVLILAAVALVAQTPATQSPNVARPSKGTDGATRRQDMVQRLTVRLHLTPDQQNQVKAIFGASREQAKALRAKMHEEREVLNKAVKSDSEQQIDQITHDNANVMAQIQAIHAKAMAKVYALLTPAQKADFDKTMTWRSNVMHRRHAGGGISHS